MSALPVTTFTLSEPLRAGDPDKVAVQWGAITLTYAKLAQDAERIAQHLSRQGIAPGDLVGIDIRKPISHWVVTLALFRLGAGSVALTDVAEREITALPGLGTVVTDDMARFRDFGRRLIEIDPSWVNGPAEGVVLPFVEEATGSVFRVTFTSGTTGRPKAVKFDSDKLSARLSRTPARSGLNSETRIWCGLGPDTNYGFTAVLGTWLAGGTVVFLEADTLTHQQLASAGVNMVLASPAALKAAASDAPDGAARSATAIAAGGRMTVALRDLLRARLCQTVQVAFGSSEAGGISHGSADLLDGHPGAVGIPFEDIQLQIVGEAGQVLPPGTEGLIRVRTESMATEYIDNPGATRDAFVDGWFAPGDRGMLMPDGQLCHLGRGADHFNLGGAKVLASDIDAAASVVPGVSDACAVIFRSEQGAEPQLAVAVAGAQEAGMTLGVMLRRELPLLPRFWVIAVAAIPRGSMGKVNREALAAHLETGSLMGLAAERIGQF